VNVVNSDRDMADYQWYTYAEPDRYCNGQRPRDHEARAIQDVLRSRERALCRVRNALRAALASLFRETRGNGDPAACQAYVDDVCRQLEGQPVKAWDHRLLQTNAAIDEARAEINRLLPELRSRLAREFWATQVSDDQRAKVRACFRSTGSDGLHKALWTSCHAWVDQNMTYGGTQQIRSQIAAREQHAPVLAGTKCPDCGAQLVDRVRGRDDGKFVGCSRYPDCRYAWGMELGSTHSGVSVEQPGVSVVTTDSDPLAALVRALARHFTTRDACDLCVEAGLDLQRPMPLDASDTSSVAWTVLLCEAVVQGREQALQARVRGALDVFGAGTSKVVDGLWATWSSCTSCTTPGTAATVKKEEVKETMSEEKTMTTTAPGIGAAFDMFVEMTKDDTGDAAWRTGADETVEILKAPAMVALKKMQRTALGKPAAAWALKALNHPLGEGVFSWASGMAIVTYGPLRGKALGPKTMRLSKELRVKGIKPFTDLFAKTIIAPVRVAIVKLVENLPDEGV
jgi:ssDNA-binding Zn-finger/Zn-ribbon topoisomerase 1